MAQSRPPAGWTCSGGVIVPAPSVSDYAARGQNVRANCQGEGCNRRIVIDPIAQVRRGLGAVHMKRLCDLWRCHRLDGCNLSFFDDAPERPLRLAHFVGLPNVRVRLRCRGSGCRFYRVWEVEQIIAGLTERRVGGEITEVAALGKLMTSACSVCKRVNWTADVLWVDPDTEGWKAMGARCFEAVEIERRAGPATPKLRGDG